MLQEDYLQASSHVLTHKHDAHDMVYQVVYAVTPRMLQQGTRFNLMFSGAAKACLCPHC